MANYPTLPETGFVRLSVILALIPVSKSTFWAKVKSGEFPRPYKLGPNITAWRVEDIRSLISSFAQCADPGNVRKPERSMRDTFAPIPTPGGPGDGK